MLYERFKKLFQNGTKVSLAGEQGTIVNNRHGSNRPVFDVDMDSGLTYKCLDHSNFKLNYSTVPPDKLVVGTIGGKAVEELIKLCQQQENTINRMRSSENYNKKRITHLKGTLENEIKTLLNSVNRESDSNTPDFILAEFMMKCLDAFELASNKREVWYGVELGL